MRSTVQFVLDTFKAQREVFGGEGGSLFSGPFYDHVKCTKVYENQGFTVVEFELPTAHWMRNGLDIVHGGCLATIVDDFSSVAMAADPKAYASDTPTEDEITHVIRTLGVSRNLQMQYVQAAPLDATLTVRCTLIANTKRNALIDVQVLHNGRLLVSASHDKSKPYVKL